nr:winged helix-turn-helix domain-containing protein [Halorussus aquaticus]
MTQGDDRILETLAESDLILSPAVIAINTEYTRNYVNKRVAVLLENDLIERVQDGYYQISEKGRQYLAGDLNANKLEDESGDH